MQMSDFNNGATTVANITPYGQTGVAGGVMNYISPLYPNSGYYVAPCYTQYWHWPTEPQDCTGRAHVFICDHAKACKCGKVKRANPEKLEK